LETDIHFIGRSATHPPPVSNQGINPTTTINHRSAMIDEPRVNQSDGFVSSAGCSEPQPGGCASDHLHWIEPALPLTAFCLRLKGWRSPLSLNAMSETARDL